MSDDKPARRAAAAAFRGLVAGVGQDVTDRVRQEMAAAGADGDAPVAQRAATAALGGLVGGVGQNVAALVRQELGAARSDALESARAAARGAGLLGGAGAAGHTAGLFVGIAIWQGLGSRIGFARSALVVAALSGAAAAALASAGTAELGRMKATRPPAAPTPPDDGPDPEVVAGLSYPSGPRPPPPLVEVRAQRASKPPRRGLHPFAG